MSEKKPTTLLCILDGFGLNPKEEGNAVAIANTPNFDRLYSTSPSSTLNTSGLRVGLPEGQMGNSEVGHLNIGAGRVVEQWLVRISRELNEDCLSRSPAFKTFSEGLADESTIHLIGLFSDGGVHSHYDHLKLAIESIETKTKANLALHLLTDGRDVSPHASKNQVAEFEEYLESHPRCQIATICGRFYAMDRDKRWERTEQAYRALALGEGRQASSPTEAIQWSYDQDVTDEFIEPIIINQIPIKAEDGIVFWNFRADRVRQITNALCLSDFAHFKREHPLPPRERVLCFTEYDAEFKLPYLFAPDDIKNHLGEVVSARGLKQLRTAETEKYPHVTYFFNGGVETEFPGEERSLIPSPKEVKTYDLKPEMSAYGVLEIVKNGIQSGKYDLIVVNFANCDMVGHTGVLEAAVKAVETVDECLGEIVTEMEQIGGTTLIIADHGNAEQMINYSDGSPHTAHTTYPVPVILHGYREKVTLNSDGALCDVAPTILKVMEIEQPSEMSGSALF